MYMAEAILMDPKSSRLAIYFQDILKPCEAEATVEILKTMYRRLKDDHRLSPVSLWVLASALMSARLVESAYELEDKLLKLFPKNMCSLRSKVTDQGRDASFLNHYLSERPDVTGDLHDVRSLWKGHYCLLGRDCKHGFSSVFKGKELFAEDPICSEPYSVSNRRRG
jgi:hypothetical protein